MMRQFLRVVLKQQQKKSFSSVYNILENLSPIEQRTIFCLISESLF